MDRMVSRVRAIYRIQALPAGPAQARRIIADELSSVLAPDDLDEVKLMVSELVTNGIIHDENQAGIPVTLDLRINRAVRCRVLTHGQGFAARVQQGANSGWDLRVVEQLADRWGMQSSPRITEVWFERAFEAQPRKCT